MKLFLSACAALSLSLLHLSAAAERHLLLVAGNPSHGPGDHEFNAGVQLLQKCLTNTPGLKTSVQLNGWPKDETILKSADAVLFYMDGGGGHPAIKGNHLETLSALVKKGVGIGCAHFGVEFPSTNGGPQFKEWIGGYYEHEFSCNPMWSPEFKKFPDHPIARGVQPFSIRDEWYFNMRFLEGMKRVTPILTAVPSDEVRKGPYVYPKGPYQHIVDASGRPEHMMWAIQREDGGRGFGFTGGHIHKNWGNDNFRKVVLNALLWISKVEIPPQGVSSKVTEEDLAQNLDPKRKK
jgi:hypothetical protein